MLESMASRTRGREIPRFTMPEVDVTDEDGRVKL
jgi:hypothetical protein